MKGKTKNIFKSKKGITLIALVVTIVVLLILAGVSISMLGGENGIITQAIEAKEENEIAEEKENVQLAVTAAKGNTNWGEITEENLKKELDKIVGDTGKNDEDKKTEITSNLDGTFNVLFKETGRNYYVDNDGKIIFEEPIDYPTLATETTSANYGDYVKYNIDYDNDGNTNDDWRIFYNDGKCIYLISSDFVKVQEYESGYSAYCSLDLNSLGYSTVDEAIDFLLNTENWNMLKDEELADYVTGATTLEMYVNSWNETNENDKLYLSNGEIGYLIGNTENPTEVKYSFKENPTDLYYINKGQMPYDATNWMWIASKMNNGNFIKGGSMLYSYESDTSGYIQGNGIGNKYVGIRPIVCLKKEVILVQGTGDIDNPFEISLK